MSVTLTIELPASAFEIGRVIEAVDGVEIDLTMVIPLGDRLLAFLAVHDYDHDSFAEQLGISDQAVVERLRRAMTKLGEEYLTARRNYRSS